MSRLHFHSIHMQCQANCGKYLSKSQISIMVVCEYMGGGRLERSPGRCPRGLATDERMWSNYVNFFAASLYYQ